MTKKYIVKNCPNLAESYYADGHISKNECRLDIYDKQCSDCTDCLIKQVVEKCKKEISDKENWCHRRALAKEILQLFTIEEVE